MGSEVQIMELPKRKSIRLPGYDDSSPGAYFVTVCTHERRCILSEIAVGALHEAPAASVSLTNAGLCVQKIIETLPAQYPALSVEHHVIMPNHVHLLLRLKERAIRESPLRQEGNRSLLSKAIGYLKAGSSKQIHFFSPGLIVWQRSYYEHVIRSEEDYRQIWEYIENNPARWAEDRYYPEASSRR